MSPPGEPGYRNQPFFHDKILSRFQIQTQDLFKKVGVDQSSRPTHPNSLQRVSEQDFVSESQQKGIGSQYSEQLYASALMRPPDARYPPEMQLIEPHEVVQSGQTTNMTMRSNANIRPAGAMPVSRQSGMQLVPGSERSSSQFRVGKHFGALPRNLTPNLQTAGRLKSPDLGRHTQVGTARRDSPAGLHIEGHEAGLQQQLPPDQSRTNRQLPGPSTTIFVNETSLINKDLDMVEAAANCVRQRSIGLQ